MKNYTLIPIVISKIKVDLGIMTYRMNYGIKQWIPVISWYIKGAEKNLLIDSGISAIDGKKYTDSPIEDIIDFEDGLKKKANLCAEDIDYVIQTHLHFDHVGNTHKCKNAKIIVQKKELEHALAPHPMQGYLYDSKLLNSLNFEIVDGDKEIFPGIDVIFLPSHTPGVQAISVNTTKGKAVVSGMCCIGDNFNPPEPKTVPQKKHDWKVVPPGNFINLNDAYLNTLKLKGFADILIPQHDYSLFDIKKIP